MRSCPSGHHASDNANFCPICRASLSESGSDLTGYSANEQPRVGPSSLGAITQSKRITVGTVIAVLALVLVGVVIALEVGGGGASNEGGPAGASATNDHRVCVLQLTAVVSHLSQGSYEPALNEVRVNGRDDPYFVIANRMVGPYAADLRRVGEQEAANNAVVAAEDACSGELEDKPRPNYPRDGSIPSDTVDVDPNLQPGTPGGYECPPGTSLTNRVNGSGNYICE